jgi:hypothetical protein
MSSSSWASIVKQENTAGVSKSTHVEMPPIEKKEEDGYCRPLFVYMVRPGAPLVRPIFQTQIESDAWEQSEMEKNQEYSRQVHDEKMDVWEKKNSWYCVPPMTEMTKEQEAIGFFPIQIPPWENFSEYSLRFGYYCPHNSDERRVDYLCFLNKFMYNRSNEIYACKTVGEFEDVYFRAYSLQFGPTAEWNDEQVVSNWRHELQDERRGARDALWALSSKANLFPGKQVKPRNPVPTTSDSGPKRYDVYSVRRGEVGVCGVKDLKTLGNSAPIRWYITPAEMRNMKQFRFCFEEDPSRRDDDYFESWSDDGFGDY